MDALIGLLADCSDGVSHWGTGGWIWMGLMMLAGVVLIVALVYALIKGFQSSGTGTYHAAPWHRETPLEIAQRRYAAGEITAEEFERIRKDLGG
ncbi:MAG: SHOCT domain-containing protein [Actinobacteria bacterium]|nr:SHOCT domain-containing protein [Actinomycetota bacterium]